jgi:hypothetical protein
MLNRKIKNELISFKRIDPAKLPPLLRYYYHAYILCLIFCCKDMIDGIFSNAESDIELPIDIKHLEKYFAGFEFVYVPPPTTGSINGHYTRDGDIVYVFYNPNLSEAQIKFTKAHELFHFYQDYDMDMRRIFNELFEHCKSDEYAENVARSLNEEAADIGAFLFLMPPEYYDKNSQQINNTFQNLIKHYKDCLRESEKFI